VPATVSGGQRASAVYTVRRVPLVAPLPANPAVPSRVRLSSAEMGLLAAQQDEVVVILHPARAFMSLRYQRDSPHSDLVAPEVYNLSVFWTAQVTYILTRNAKKLPLGNKVIAMRSCAQRACEKGQQDFLYSTRFLEGTHHNEERADGKHRGRAKASPRFAVGDHI